MSRKKCKNVDYFQFPSDKLGYENSFGLSAKEIADIATNCRQKYIENICRQKVIPNKYEKLSIKDYI
ncbi:MAG: hypothetical protein QW303_03250 [Nitrososphaerota archaeon]